MLSKGMMHSACRPLCQSSGGSVHQGPGHQHRKWCRRCPRCCCPCCCCCCSRSVCVCVYGGAGGALSHPGVGAYLPLQQFRKMLAVLKLYFQKIIWLYQDDFCVWWCFLSRNAHVLCVFHFCFCSSPEIWQLQELHCLFLSVSVVFTSVQTMVWLPVFGDFYHACRCWGVQLHKWAVQTLKKLSCGTNK